MFSAFFIFKRITHRKEIKWKKTLSKTYRKQMGPIMYGTLKMKWNFALQIYKDCDNNNRRMYEIEHNTARKEWKKHRTSLMVVQRTLNQIFVANRRISLLFSNRNKFCFRVFVSHVLSLGCLLVHYRQTVVDYRYVRSFMCVCVCVSLYVRLCSSQSCRLVYE